MTQPQTPSIGSLTRSNLGRTTLRAYMNLVGVPPSPAKVLFDATYRAGQAMDLALRIQRHGQVSAEKLRLFAKLANLAPSDLQLWCVKELERADLVEATRNPLTGEIEEVEEQVGIAAPVLEQAAAIWENLSPSLAERCAIASSDHLTFAPMTESDHRAALETDGFPEQAQDEALAALAAIGMLHRVRSQRLHEDVLFSPYVWGTEAVDIAEFMKNLPANERQMLAGLSRTVAERPGTSIENLSTSSRLLQGAQKVGLIDSARVITQGGTGRNFGFSPSLERALRYGPTDVAHERKLFVAHILFGHRFAPFGTGRIDNPILLVERLIERRVVGPATAIKRDYPLLEAKGIVRVQKVGERAYLHLVKEDVARDGLELLRLALADAEPAPGAKNPLEALWLPGSFRAPERTRAELPPLQPGAEAEVITSTVEQLREEAARAMRREVV
ncbi:MAG: hypothetical protein WD249_05415 [Gaiellaceae bacterium]